MNKTPVINHLRHSPDVGLRSSFVGLSSHREKDGVLYVDLQVNGMLDRETKSFYEIVLAAFDGGLPPLNGTMTVNVKIQDVNDNQPIFNQSRYFATIGENATIGTSVLQSVEKERASERASERAGVRAILESIVFATDTDTGPNAAITYSMNRRHSDREGMFAIDERTGVISVSRPLDFETKDAHELVVVARDNGAQPLETTAFISIRVLDVNDNQPTINLIFLSDDATPKISEDAQPGEYVARISVNDPDSDIQHQQPTPAVSSSSSGDAVNVTLEGGDGHFGLTTQDNIIYLVIVSKPLDRELKPNYTLVVTATDQGSPPLHASRSFQLRVTDMNDNAPEFAETLYYASVLEVADPGTSVFQLTASDRDQGRNSVVHYSILSEGSADGNSSRGAHSNWFHIHPRTGLITTRTHIDCETDPIPSITVMAVDGGDPPLSSSTTVLITIRDVNDNEPIFDQSFYNVSVKENQPVGTCILQVSASDPDCGVNAMVNYTIGMERGFGKFPEFSIEPTNGQVCLAGNLDREVRHTYEFPIVATDRGGLSTTAMVKVQVEDVNDNAPVFYPREYNVSLREGTAPHTPVVVVVASDPDSGQFGAIRYRIQGDDHDGLFRVHDTTGECANRFGLVNGGCVIRNLVSPLLFDFDLAEQAEKNHGAKFYRGHNISFLVSLLFCIRKVFLTGGGEALRRLARTEEGIRLNVSATDGGGLSATLPAQVTLSIIGPNQKPPVFRQPRYSFEVPEDVSIGTQVGSVAATASNTGHGSVRYSVYNGDPNGYFTVDPVSGMISTKSRLDHETQPFVLLNIQAASGNPSSYGHTQVNITIGDVNDNSPEFDGVSVRISVPEDADTTSRTALYAVHAQDADDGANGRVRYKLVDGKPSYGLEAFRVDPESGVVTLVRPLDHEVQARYDLSVLATDLGVPPLSAYLQLRIDVQDVNDNGPVFKQTRYEVSVPEGLAMNAHVVQVEAEDEDSGNNARMTYSIVQSQHPRTFGVFPNSGIVYLVGELDRENETSYEITVLATDNGSPERSSSVVVAVTVTDVNDNAPHFAQDVYQFTVEEGRKAGTLVGSVSAVDPDSGPNATLTYVLLHSNRTFVINSRTGQLSLGLPLDRERQPVYEIQVEARDQGSPPLFSRTTVRVLVTDINDHAPEFLGLSAMTAQNPTSRGDRRRLEVSIREQQPIGTQVTRIQAIDRDEGPNATISFRLKPGDAEFGGSIVKGALDVFEIDAETGVVRTRKVLSHAGNDGFRLLVEVGNEDGHFVVEPATGMLLTARTLDRELRAEFLLDVVGVSDQVRGGARRNSVRVQILIADVNDNAPVFDRDPVVLRVSESAGVGTVVGNVTAEDADDGPNGEVEYVLLAQWPADRFAIDAATGRVTVRELVDYELVAEYTLVVEARDKARNPGKRLRASQTVRILVTDANDHAPAFLEPVDSVAVLEDEPVGFPLIHFRAVDGDAGENGHLRFSIASGNSNGAFRIDAETGLLWLDAELDRETVPVYSLNVTTTDGTWTASHSLTVEVLDVNDNRPQFTRRRFFANISEDAPVGTFVFRVEAHDVDQGENGNLTFVLPEGLPESASFRINGKSGEIFTGEPMDREVRAVTELTVFVRDGGNPPLFDVATVVVSLLDINDNVPTFTASSCGQLHVPENSAPAVVHTVLAVDADSGARNGLVTYSITGGNEGKEFRMDAATGKLSVGGLDRETRQRYRLEITARDGGSPSLAATCNLTVHVLDENDNDPVFPQPRYHATLPEDAMPGSSVIHIRASDLDAGLNSRITYSFTNETHWLFAIHNESGLITTAGAFDREKQGVYSFHVRATDAGQYNARWEEVEVQVTISDVNDHAPEFTEYPFSAQIQSNVEIGQQLVRVATHDPDDGVNSLVTYRLASKSPLFDIEPDTGVIRAASSLRSESGKLFQLEVIAVDGGNPSNSATGLVEVRVVGSAVEEAVARSRSPTIRFTSPSYEVSLDENAVPGREVVQVSAVRSDGRRQRITYRFGRGNENNAFEINANNGLIRVRDSELLDHELDPEIRLIVMARTDGEDPVFGYVAVTVRLEDVNDNTPRFTQNDYSAVVWEGHAKGAFVTRILATDRDFGQNARLSYHIVDGNQDNAFLIEPPYSGEVKTNIVLDREIRDSYLLTVIATDEGSPQRTGTCTLKVNIVDVNDNQPTFPPTSLVSISEGAQVGTVVMTVTANDVDTSPTLTYTFVESEEEAARGDVETFSLDRFTGRLLLVRALDFELKQSYQLQISASDSVNTATTILTVQVQDDNDNPPQFLALAYMASISMNTKPGTSIAQASATDRDAGENGRIRYSLKRNRWSDMFHIDRDTGTLYVNKTLSRGAKPQSRSAMPRTPLPSIMRLIVVANDGGRPTLSAAVPVHVVIKRAFAGVGKLSFPKKTYSLEVEENTPKGSILMMLEVGESHSLGLNTDLCCIHYWLNNSSSVMDTFQIMSSSGELVLLKDLDREAQQNYSIVVSACDRRYPDDTASTRVTISVKDVNDSPPTFAHSAVNVSVPESMAEGALVAKLSAIDADSGSFGLVFYDILSGNDVGLFRIDNRTGEVYLNGKLDFETETQHRLVVRARDGKNGTRASLSTLTIAVEDENEFGPEFPTKIFHAFLAENARPGSEVTQLRAVDGDTGQYGKLNYSLAESNSWDSNWFTIQPESGAIYSQKVMDYEDGRLYTLVVTAMDPTGASASAKVVVHVESRDEYPPEFIQDHYAFAAPAEIPAGYVIGQVQATDQDKGVDGVVIYDVDSQLDSGFGVNVTTGAIVSKRSMSLPDGSEVKMRVIASSGQAGSLKGHATVNVKVDKNLSVVGLSSKADAALEAALAPWALALVIILALVASILFAAILILRIRSGARKRHKPQGGATGAGSTVGGTGPGDHHYDTAFDPLDMCGGSGGLCPAGALDGSVDHGNPYSLSFGNEFNVTAAYETASGAGSTLKHHLHLHHPVVVGGTSNQSEGSLSGSASSGRGSAEEGDGDPEDAEIRMINEGPLRLSMPDSGLHEEDNMSDTSAQNTQEYLARLGIVENSAQGSEHGGRKLSDDPLDQSLEHMYDNGVSGSDHHPDISQLLGGPRGTSGNASGNVSVSGSQSGVVGIGGSVPVGQPSMTGSLSSIVHSEEELTGSYNWDYLLDWGPQYQPLAHVFSEIARLKDDSVPASSGVNGGSGAAYGAGPAGAAPPPPPPPLLTCVAPPSAARAAQVLPPMARSPIHIDDSNLNAAALSPSFSPALSPLATRSPSISPLAGPSPSATASVARQRQLQLQRQQQQRYHHTTTLPREPEFRI
ncbi:unnamed protein product [Notodromas monacha]|uniref:Cadherin domain-containing protein n=1 Tax=Notodromas monacha TaxID=399045 RepID=A0A7R9BSF8_9CRUS|nr:unnamed protein product [Notodromas monacha]CAG0919475.1 unnamed protein product [Notodromas monacha]